MNISRNARLKAEELDGLVVQIGQKRDAPNDNLESSFELTLTGRVLGEGNSRIKKNISWLKSNLIL